MKFEVKPFYFLEGKVRAEEKPFTLVIENYDELFNYGYTKKEIEEIKNIKINETKTIEVLDMIKTYQEFTRKY